MNSTNSSVQHVALSTQKDFFVQDILCRGAISSETKPQRNKHQENSKKFQGLCENSKSWIFSFQYPISQLNIHSANPHRFSFTVIVWPIFAYWTGCASVTTLQLETHQSIIGQIYSAFVHQKHWRENLNWSLCWISCNNWLCLYLKIMYSRKR